MKRRCIPLLALSLALLAPACSGDAGADPSGLSIKAATSYTITRYAAGERWSPRSWRGTQMGGGTLRSSDLNGAVTVVNFWASWCGPCRVEQAALEALHKEFAARGARFVGVNIRDTMTNARAHLEEFGVTYPSVFNPDSLIAYKFRVIHFIPTTFVLDRRGRVAAKIIGPTVERDLIAVLNEELGT